MSRAKKPTSNDSVQARALVNRQVQAREKHAFAIAAADWLPNGKLFPWRFRVQEEHTERGP